MFRLSQICFQMSPAKASTSNDAMVTTTTVTELASQTENNKKDDPPAKKTVEFNGIVDDQISKSKLCEDKMKLEVMTRQKLIS